jgi:hypothetical protein
MIRIYSSDYLTYFFAHYLLGDFGVVNSKEFLICVKGTSFLVTLQMATILVILYLETPIQKLVHVIWRGLV